MSLYLRFPASREDQSLLEEVRALLQAGDFHAAWTRTEGGWTDRERHRARAEIRYRAGDPAGALAEAGAGLAVSSEDLELLFYRSASLLWLEDGVAAQESAEKLLRAVQAESASLGTEERAAWQETARSQLSQAGEILQHDAAREAALAGSRAVAVAMLALALLVAAWGALRRPR